MGMLDKENANKKTSSSTSSKKSSSSSGGYSQSVFGGGSKSSSSAVANAYSAGLARGSALSGSGNSGFAGLASALSGKSGSNPFSSAFAGNASSRGGSGNAAYSSTSALAGRTAQHITTPQVQIAQATPFGSYNPNYAGAPRFTPTSQRGTLAYLNQQAATKAGVNMAMTPNYRTSPQIPGQRPTYSVGQARTVASAGAATDFGAFYTPGASQKTNPARQAAQITPAGARGAPQGLMSSIFAPNTSMGYDPSPEHGRVLDTMIAETGADPLGLAAVAHTINTRSKRSGASPFEVVSAPGQFEGYSNPNYGSRAAMQDPAVRAAAERAYQDAITGKSADPTDGADFFNAKGYDTTYTKRMERAGDIAGNSYFRSGSMTDSYRTGGGDRGAGVEMVSDQRVADPGSTAAQQMAAERAKRAYEPQAAATFPTGGIGSDKDTGVYPTETIGTYDPAPPWSELTQQYRSGDDPRASMLFGDNRKPATVNGNQGRSGGIGSDLAYDLQGQNPIQAAAEGGGLLDLAKGGLKSIVENLKKGEEFALDPARAGIRAGIEYAMQNPGEAMKALSSGASAAFDTAGREIGKAANAATPRFVNAASMGGQAGEIDFVTGDPVETAMKVRDLKGNNAAGWEALNSFPTPPTEMQKTRYSQQSAGSAIKGPNLYDEPGYTPPTAPELVTRALGPTGALIKAGKSFFKGDKEPYDTKAPAKPAVPARPATPQPAKAIHSSMDERRIQIAEDRAGRTLMSKSVTSTSIPYKDEPGSVTMPAGDYSSPATAPWQNDLPTAITQSAHILKVDPVKWAGIIHFESGFNPAVRGGKKDPATGAGAHIGLIQFDKDNQARYSVTQQSSIADQMKAATQYALDRGFLPGVHGEKELYATVNAGYPGGGSKSDTAAGGTWGSADDKFFSQMSESNAAGAKLLGTQTYTGGYGGTGTTVAGQNLKDETLGSGQYGAQGDWKPTTKPAVFTGQGNRAYDPSAEHLGGVRWTTPATNVLGIDPIAGAMDPTNLVQGQTPAARRAAPRASPGDSLVDRTPQGIAPGTDGMTGVNIARDRVTSALERINNYRGRDSGSAITRQEIADFLARKNSQLLKKLSTEGKLKALAELAKDDKDYVTWQPAGA